LQTGPTPPSRQSVIERNKTAPAETHQLQQSADQTHRPVTRPVARVVGRVLSEPSTSVINQVSHTHADNLLKQSITIAAQDSTWLAVTNRQRILSTNGFRLLTTYLICLSAISFLKQCQDQLTLHCPALHSSAVARHSCANFVAFNLREHIVVTVTLTLYFFLLFYHYFVIVAVVSFLALLYGE